MWASEWGLCPLYNKAVHHLNRKSAMVRVVLRKQQEPPSSQGDAEMLRQLVAVKCVGAQQR